MKRLFTAASACLIALVISLFLGSCDAKESFRREIIENDSLMIIRMMTGIDNPQFSTAKDAIEYQRSEKQWMEQDSVFYTIPENVLPNIVSVLQKNGEPITKNLITDEFITNKRIYLNLPDKPMRDITPPDIPNVKVVDTIIDGKKVHLIEAATTPQVKVTQTTED